MISKDPWFDAFFQAVTSSPEFKWAMTKDWKWDSKELLETSLKEMEEWVTKASEMMQSFQDTFWKESDFKKEDSQEKLTWEETKIPPSVQVQYFTKKDSANWGFAGVAGMEKLKTELTDSFIKPLRFKFLIEKLKKEKESKETEEMKEIWDVNFPPDKSLSSTWLGRESKELEKNQLYLKLYEVYEKFKISIPTGMLFYGPPGTGKTFITKKLAEELECGFISKNMGEFGSSYLHQTTKNIKEFFDGAKKVALNEPILLFLDEIDSLVSARTQNVDSNKAEEVSQFLQEFNKLAEEAPNLIVIAATNRPDHLDSAILRSGRLDKKIYLWPPDDEARKALFKMYIEKAGRPHEELDYDELMRLTVWYVSADIEAICDEVARDASREILALSESIDSLDDIREIEKHKITMDNLRKTIMETPSSLKAVDMSIYENWLEKMK
jgi:SpoVK/Ycf46/Vps4 family AAA+-type ATPase